MTGRVEKAFGVGLAVAALLHATVGRTVIVLAVMAVLDRQAWRLPTWLHRITPNLDVEGEERCSMLVNRPVP